jgi:hypothetical protein
MAEPTRCRDSRAQRVFRFIDAIEILERERESPKTISLVIIRREIGAQLLRRLGVESLLQRLVGESESRQHVVRMLRHHRAERLQPRAHLPTRSVTMSATR